MINACAMLGSRREFRRFSRRKAILDVAHDSFMEHGYAGTKMSRIAEMLGGSKGTLWSYFPSKDLLFAAVIDRASQEFRAQLAPILNAQDDIGQILLRFAREFIKKITSPEAVALNRLVIGEANRFPETGQIFYERAVARTRDLLALYIAGAMERGLLRRDEPQRAAQELIALCSHSRQQRQLLGVIDGSVPEIFEDDAEHGVATFLHAYATSMHQCGSR